MIRVCAPEVSRSMADWARSASLIIEGKAVPFLVTVPDWELSTLGWLYNAFEEAVQALLECSFREEGQQAWWGMATEPGLTVDLAVLNADGSVAWSVEGVRRTVVDVAEAIKANRR